MRQQFLIDSFLELAEVLSSSQVVHSGKTSVLDVQKTLLDNFLVVLRDIDMS